MCFSAEASFVASAVLAVVGFATLKKASKPAYRWIALVPLLFAIQQFSEGVLWLYLPDTHSPVALVAKYTYLLFAYLFWPIWIPFSLYMAESQPVRRTIIGWSLVAGILMVSYFLFPTLSSGGSVGVSVVGHSIQYSADEIIWRIIYSAIVIVPCFASSLRGMKIFGALAGLTVIVTSLFYTHVFVSVWCFFAALISLVLYGVLRINRT